MFDAVKRFVQRNTPEAALVGAIATAVAGYYSGALGAHDAVQAVVAAFVVFVLAEAHVDAASGGAS